MDGIYFVGRKVLYGIAFALIIDSIIIVFSGFNTSKLFAALMGGIILFLLLVDKAFRESDSRKIFRIIQVGIIVFALSFVLIELVIVVASPKQVNFADVVIVLGSGTNNNKPATILQSRLDVASSYLYKHPESFVVLSGGRGQDEAVSEAVVMRDYLLAKGVPAYKIKTEDKSTDTLSNFQNSKTMLDKWFGGQNYITAYVTSDFHVFRAGETAKKVGLNAAGISAPTEWYQIPNYYIREYFAIIGFYLTGS